jgi:hypothetical protein
MEIIDTDKIKRLKKANEIINDLQRRLYKAENCIDDLTRAIEIAVISRQWQTVDPFVADGHALLEDRLVVPLRDGDGDSDYTVIEGNIEKEVFDGITDKVKEAGIKQTKPTTIGINKDLKAVGNTTRMGSKKKDAEV